MNSTAEKQAQDSDSPPEETQALAPVAVAMNLHGIDPSNPDMAGKIIRELAVTPIYPANIGETFTYTVGTSDGDHRFEAMSDRLRLDTGLGHTVRTVFTWGDFEKRTFDNHLNNFRARGLIGSQFHHVLEFCRFVDFQAAYQAFTGETQYLSFADVMRVEGKDVPDRMTSSIRSRALAEIVLTFV